MQKKSLQQIKYFFNLQVIKVPTQIAGNLLMENREFTKDSLFLTMKKVENIQ